jgi:hypothetical protein
MVKLYRRVQQENLPNLKRHFGLIMFVSEIKMNFIGAKDYLKMIRQDAIGICF